jgi:hypothetical protein
MESAAAENVKSKGDQRLAYLLLGKLFIFKHAKMDYNTIDENTSEKIVLISLSILFCVAAILISNLLNFS